MPLKTLCIFGTRPEAIKMAPLIKELRVHSQFCNKTCVTGQHETMLKTVLDLFDIKPDFNLKVMESNQNLSGLTAKILSGLLPVFEAVQPELVLVHGDTTTTLAASLSAYYHKVPIAHVEAGLRTKNIYSPWPEEVNRKLTDALAALHFAPTALAKQHLLEEGVSLERIFLTGNTVVDALFDVLAQIEANPLMQAELLDNFSFLKEKRPFILVTTHRRENFGLGFQNIARALIQISELFPEVDIVYPVHLNPNVQEKIRPLLEPIHNIYLLSPLDYLSFVFLMQQASLILTDSGGIQEEALALNKPLLVMREHTERQEVLDDGCAKLVGTNREIIVEQVSQILSDKQQFHRLNREDAPYGGGKAARRIIQILSEIFMQERANQAILNVSVQRERMNCVGRDEG